MIGITGASGSGKSRLAREIRALFKSAAVLAQDRFYHNAFSDQDPAQVNFDLPQAINLDEFLQTIGKLQKGKSVQLPIWDFTTNQRACSTDLMHPPEILIVEGLHVLYFEELARMLDFSVFLYSSPEVILARRILRDMEERNRSAQYCIQQYFQFTKSAYEKFVHPTREIADMVILNNFDTPFSSLVDEFQTGLHYRIAIEERKPAPWLNQDIHV